MLLERYDIEEIEENIASHAGVSPPLIVTNDAPRKAFFKKINRQGLGAEKSSKRVTRKGHVLRGNSFAGMASGQRVVVKISVSKNRTKGVGVGAGSGAKNLYHHVRYIGRSGAGQDETKAILFDRDNDGVDGKEFHELCKNDRHHFRMIISPENGHDIDNFRGYIRTVMSGMEKDLGTDLEWISAVHYDTDDVHAHVIVRGVNDRGKDLVIGRDYISFGVRAKAQEVATELLGERSLDEIQKSMEAEVDAMRITSLDRFIDKQADDNQVIDVRKKSNFGKSAHYEGLIKGRLRYLEVSGLAVEYPPGVYTLKEGYKETLAKLSMRDDVLKKLYSRVDTGLDNLSIYSIRSGEGSVVEGRIIDKGAMDEITDRKYIVLRDAQAKLHYVPVGEVGAYEDIQKGSLIRIRPGDKSTGKSDFNISKIAVKNDGIYDEQVHLAHIEKEQAYIKPEDRKRYLDAHKKRLETLEKNGAVVDLGKGRYEVPADIVARGAEITKIINAHESKRFYPRMDILSAQPVEELVSKGKKTWLDKELYKQSIGKQGLAAYDAEISSALEKRKDWLVNLDLAYIQSNGEFALRDGALLRLDKLEVHKAGKKLARQANLTFNESKVRAGEQQTYLGYVELETGVWSVSMKGKVLQMAHLEKIPDFKRGAPVVYKDIGNGKFDLGAGRAKEQARGRDQDKDQGREL